MITYKVKLSARKRTEAVTADYFRVDNGILTFRNAATDNKYPVFIKCYAPGVWLSVENASVRETP